MSEAVYDPEGAQVSWGGVVCEGFSKEAPVTINSPWWRLLKDDGKVTTLDLTSREGNHCTIDLYNDSEGLKSILESDPYGENRSKHISIHLLLKVHV